MEDNPYAPPKSPLVDQSDSDDSVISELKYGSTWKLVGLGIITMGIYLGHYMIRQNQILNKSLSGDDRISNTLVRVILVLGYGSFFLFVPVLISDEYLLMEKASDAADRIWGILTLIWGFKARNRMNLLLGASKGTSEWFHGFWTFLLTPVYFNYKINVISESAS